MLVALRAVVPVPDEQVHLRHIPSRAPSREIVGQRTEFSHRALAAGSSTSSIVVSEVPNLNHMHGLERLDSVWLQGSPAVEPSSPFMFDEGFDVVENPSRRIRTALTEKEVEAIRTAREGGESVMSIAKRFRVHRATVWEHTKLRPTEERSEIAVPCPAITLPPVCHTAQDLNRGLPAPSVSREKRNCNDTGSDELIQQDHR